MLFKAVPRMQGFVKKHPRMGERRALVLWAGWENERSSFERIASEGSPGEPSRDV